MKKRKAKKKKKSEKERKDNLEIFLNLLLPNMLSKAV